MGDRYGVQRPPDQNPLFAQSPPAEGEVVLRGVVRGVVFRKEDQSFSVVRLTLINGDDATVVGPLGDLSAGEPVRVNGRWEQHGSHGRQLRATSVVPEMPTTEGGIERLLGSGFVPDIGARLAQRIVGRFGASTLDVIADHPERLSEVGGIGEKRARSIQEAFRARRAEAETKSYLQGVGLGPALARRVWERFGVDTAKVVQANPYRLAEEVPGIAFRTADSIAEMVGIAKDDPRRITGAALFLLLESVEEGHVALPPDHLAALAQPFEIPASAMREALDRLTRAGTVVLDRALVYPPPLLAAEQSLALDFARFVSRPVPAVDAKVMELPAVREALAPLNAKQREAVDATRTSGLLVLTGGPGTGKTTATRALVTLHASAGAKVVLAAPTGRAAKRLSEATQRPASTIHRLLEWNPRLGRFSRDRHAPLDADLVLVDEASMVDVQLAASLIAAVRPGARVVFVGDVDQLPPVGPGTVLADLLATRGVRSVRLTEVFRQASASAIVRGAYAVLRGDAPVSSPARTVSPSGPRPPAGELFLVKCDDGEKAARLLVESVARRIPNTFGLDPIRDVQVLVPTHRGPLGAQALNLALQAALNPHGEKGRRGIAVGDKVMQHKNDYDLDVWNGDVGTVLRVDEKTVTVSIDGREVVYANKAIDNLSLAYAATVHKSQGSEYDAVVIGLHTSHFVLLNRALIYTAITRARRLVVIVGNERAMRLAVSDTRQTERFGALRERLRDALDGG